MNSLGRVIVLALALMLVALPLVAVLNGWFASERWPLRQLRLTADYQRVDADAVREAVTPHLAGGFFAVSLEDIHAAVVAIDWVAEAEVRKQFPDRIEISIREHVPVAHWGDGRLLSAAGQIFPLPAAGAPEGLPVFEADDRRSQDVVRVHDMAEQAFTTQGLQVELVKLSARGSWSFRLGGGAIVMAGRGDPERRVTRFAPLLGELLQHELRPLVRADLRYANGFALRWGEAPAPEAAPSASIDFKEQGA
ncbi:MAG: FtsQ-type POTRA domain-containing protein [Xanthomonadales bacterium]|nr:FtsQ-type POTRA domain-containing protein [Xanthomonadales bacterium]